MKVYRIFFLFFAIYAALLSPNLLSAQMHISDKKDDLALLQLSAGFFYVVKETRISLDSCLVLTSQRHQLSRIPVITEGFDERYPMQNYSWMDNGKVASALKKANLLSGVEDARLLLALGAYYAFQPPREKAMHDKAYKFLNLANEECASLGLTKWSAQCQLLLGKCYFLDNRVPEGKAAFEKAVELARLTKDKALEAKAYNYEGMYCPFLPETMAFRISCHEKAVHAYAAVNDDLNRSNALMDIAYVNFAIGRLKESEVAVKESLAIQESRGFPYIHYSLDLQAFENRMKGDFASSLHLALRSVKSAETTRDSLALAFFYLRVGEGYYYAVNHHQESFLWYKKSLDIFIKQGGDPGMYKIFTNKDFLEYNFIDHQALISTLKGLMKKYPPADPIELQDAYMAMGASYEYMLQYQAAEKYFLMAKKLEPDVYAIRGDINQSFIYSRLGTIYTKMGNHKMNRFYNNKFIATSKDSLSLIQAYWQLSQADSALGDFPKMRNLYMYAMLKDKMMTRAKNKQVEELDIQYQTLQKQKDLEIYKSKSLLQTEQAATTRRFYYAGLLVLMVVIVIIWSRYNNKRKGNELLQNQKVAIDQKNLQLQQAVKEKDELLLSKEWLLKELHHRVKNNLQLVMSLLTSQSAYLKDEAALNAVMESQHRVQAMSLIHQKLYKNDNMSSIYLPEYINDLLDYLKESYHTEHQISFERHIAPVYLDVIQAIPLGLILNEVVTNAIKYAFPYTASDHISVRLSLSSVGEVILTVSDNGPGLPAGFDVFSTNSFGMKLIKGLTDDLEGSFVITSVVGTTVEIRFQTPNFLRDDHQHVYGTDEPSTGERSA